MVPFFNDRFVKQLERHYKQLTQDTTK
jgi:hypothetical protein